MWKIERCGARKPWVIKTAKTLKCRDRPLSTSAPPASTKPAHRTPAPGEPLAYCAKCREWTPMRWRPKSERGKRAEQWFQCEYCGGRDLTLRYLSPNDAMCRQ